MNAPDPQARLVDLETRLAYQEDTLEKLDAVIADQARRLARLESALERLERRLEGLHDGDAAPGDPLTERPPHY